VQQQPQQKQSQSLPRCFGLETAWRGTWHTSPKASTRKMRRTTPHLPLAGGTSWRQLDPAEQHLSTHSASVAGLLYGTGGDSNKGRTGGGSSHSQQAYGQRHRQQMPLSSGVLSPADRPTQVTSTNLYCLKNMRPGPLHTGSAAGQLPAVSW
jgi:hypothetical protein